MKAQLMHMGTALCFTCKECGNSFNGLGYKVSPCYPDFAGKAFTYFCQDCATVENERRKS